MRAAGCDTVVDAADLAVVGITEILSHLPKIWGLFHRLIAEADKRRPNLAVVIDAPAFNWRVARQMRKRGIPVVYYVCPQFWAWRQGRVKLLRNYVDRALVIFPFEEKFYRDRGVNAVFVGHPLSDLARPSGSREDYAQQHQLNPAKPWITVMPGSRRKEVHMNLPVILESVAKLASGHEFLLPVAPTLDRVWIQKQLQGLNIRLVPETLPALAHSRAGIIASGTATVEAALMELPFVMVYRVTPLTYLLGKPRIKVRYFAMVNLIAGKEVVPELVQHDFTADKVVAHVTQLVANGPVREKMLDELGAVRLKLAGDLPPGIHPADRAAEMTLSLLKTDA
jgi:lipid-A-disaccharide synthase